jgi:hypothetical protein
MVGCPDRRGIPRHFALRALSHVDTVDALAVGGIGVTESEFPGVVLGLRHAFSKWVIPWLGLDDGEFVVAIDQYVIGGQCFATPPVAFDAAKGDGILARDAAAFDHTPTGSLKGGIDVLGSGFGFIHGVGL